MDSFFKNLSLDRRSLGLFRILIGLVLLVEFSLAIFHADYFYNELSFFSKELIQSQFRPNYLSIFYLIDHPLFVSLTLGLGVIASLLFILGRFVKPAQIVLLVLWASLVNRNFVIANSGDDILYLALLWSLFLPLNEALTLKGRDHSKSDNLIHPMVLPFILQLVLIYFFSVFEKNHPIWNQDFTALEYALHLDSLRTPFGQWLLQFPGLLKVGTWLTYHGEFLGPLVFFVPFVQCRVLVMISFILLHSFILLCFNIGSFPLICIFYWMAFIPSEVWDRFQNIGHIHFEPSQFKGIKFKPFAIALSVFIFLMNLIYVADSSLLPYVEKVTNPLRLRQKWSMFAPAPKNGDGRLVFQGNLKDGSVVDVHPPYSKLPEGYKRDDFTNTFLYPNPRWHKLAENMRSRQFSSFLIPFVKWVCKVQKPNELEWLYLYVVEGPTVLGKEDVTLPRRLLIRWNCFEN